MSTTDTANPSSAFASGATAAASGASPLTWVALTMAAATTAGSLWLSMGPLQLKACPLCFYQRTFVMSVVAVLVVGLLCEARRSRFLGLLAFPLTVSGLGVACFHVYLELTGVLECPSGLFGFGTAPQQSLAAFAVLTALLGLDALVSRSATGGWLALGAAAVLGVGFAVAAVQSSPPLPKPPPEAHKGDFDTCRRPFRPPSE